MPIQQLNLIVLKKCNFLIFIGHKRLFSANVGGKLLLTPYCSCAILKLFNTYINKQKETL
ncbi:hypothetical protein LAM01_08660 [Amylolactobacillus amylophilus]|nr:hypothetical protein LAM01_08660 [Amylolactobacillus amylophilus]